MSKAWVPMSEAGSEKVVPKGKGKEKAVVEPEVEEEEEVDSEKGEVEDTPHLRAQRRWAEWLNPDNLSITKYVNDDKRLKELFMTFATGMVEEQWKTRKAVEGMSEMLGKMVDVTEKMGRMSARLAKTGLEIEKVLKEMKQEMGERKRKREEESEPGGSRRKKMKKSSDKEGKGESEEDA